MKKISIYLLFALLLNQTYAQIISPDDANALMSLPQATDLAEINAINTPQIGSVVYNLADEEIYRYTGPAVGQGWKVATDDQNAGEVPLVTNVDVNYDTSTGTGTTLTTPPIANETTVEEVVQAIAPITSKAGRVFFPPSITIDASTNGTDRILDLYDLYLQQYSLTPPPIGVTPVETAVSDGAPATIPVYLNTELYYYVTYADPAVFDNITITQFGVMEYDIVGQPTNDNTIINVVFVVK